MKIDLGMAPGAEERIAKAIGEGVKVEDYYVSAAQLRVVIQEADANQDIKDKMLAFLEEKLINGAEEIQAVELGYTIGEFIESTEDRDALVILAEIRDLNRLPFTRIGNIQVN